MKIFTGTISTFILLLPVVAVANGGGADHMMGWGSGGMMSGGIFGALGLVMWLVWFVISILLMIWLWQQINKD